MEGYELRRRVSRKLRSRVRRVGDTKDAFTGSTHSKSQQVMSWRDEVVEQPVLSSVADPYGWLLESSAQRKRKLAVLNNSLGSEEPPVVDEGHAFWTQKEEFRTSLPGTNQVWWAPTGGGAVRLHVGGPGVALGATPKPALQGAMPFKFANLSNNGPNPSRTQTASFRSAIYPPAQGSLADFGRRAISIVAPGRPNLDLFAAIGELLAGFPRIPGHTLEAVRDSWVKRGSGEFLNFVFGINPTIQDLSELVNTLTRFTEILLQLRRDSGRAVRREFDPSPLQVEVEYQPEDLSDQGYVQLGHTNMLGFQWAAQSTSSIHRPYNATYTSTLSLRKYEKLRFTGSFTYWLPKTPLEGFDWSQVAEFNRVLRVTPSPTGVWQIIPWSWLLDWFLSTSATLELLERTLDDSLVINYGYAQRRVIYVARQTTTVHAPTNYPFDKQVVSSVSTFEKKERVRANPYGFISPTASEMTPLRWAILSAIGISRSPRGYN